MSVAGHEALGAAEARRGVTFSPLACASVARCSGARLVVDRARRDDLVVADDRGHAFLRPSLLVVGDLARPARCAGSTVDDAALPHLDVEVHELLRPRTGAGSAPGRAPRGRRRVPSADEVAGQAAGRPTLTVAPAEPGERDLLGERAVGELEEDDARRRASSS